MDRSTAVFLLAAWASPLGAQTPAPAAPDSAAVPPGACSAGFTAKTTYAAVLVGNRAGALVNCEAKDGTLELVYAFNDRGRGPSTRTRLKLDAQGLPVFEETSGVDYLKNEISERLTWEKGRVAWRNKAEKGGKALASPAYYIGYSAPPIDLGFLAVALAKTKDGRLALLPEGDARLERRGKLTLRVGGKDRELEHDTVSGLGFAPAHVWRDAGGGFFGLANAWFSLVPEGAEGVLTDLLKAQTEDDARRAADAAKRLARKPAGPVAITNARLFDSVGAVSRPGMTVVVWGEHIAAVGPDGGTTIPEGAERIDAHGRSLIPGLWDMHVHLSDGDGLLDLAAGVTSVRDLANEDETLRALEKSWDEGSAIGPRIVRAGFIDGPGPYHGPTKALAATPDEMRALIRGYASKGYVQIKLYSSIAPELVPVAALEAHRLGMRLSGHIPAFMTAEQAVRAGYDEIQHANMLFLNFLFDEVKDTRTPERFTAVAKKAAELDLSSPRVKEFLRLLAERHVVSDPTVAAFENMFVDRPGEMALSFRANASRFPAQVRRGFLDGGLPVPAGMDQRYRDSFRAMLKLVAALHANGIPIVAGTDGLAGFQLARELELYVEAGLTPAEVLRIATLGAAHVAGREARLGSITPGKLADLVLVDGDAAARISDVRNVDLVVKGGVFYDADALSKEIGMAPRGAAVER
jgi:imidazolonepropionase-like amidohydrolase